MATSDSLRVSHCGDHEPCLVVLVSIPLISLVGSLNMVVLW